MTEALITVRLQPRASRDELLAIRDGVLVVRVTAPPVDGRANHALCRLIARYAGVGPSSVRVVRGERGRDKIVGVSGINAESLLALVDADLARAKAARGARRHSPAWRRSHQHLPEAVSPATPGTCSAEGDHDPVEDPADD
jgi:uncharacterized protein (TIGR00251 family)